MRMLLLKTWRDLLARKGQFIGLTFLVVLGVSTFVAFLTGYLDLTASATKANEELRFADFSTKVLGAPPSIVEKVERVPGVRAAEGRLVADTGLDLGGDEQAAARVIGVPVEREPRVNRLLLLAGREPSSAGQREALLHAKFSTDAGVGPGDTLTLRIGRDRRTLRVSGVVASAEYMYPIRQKGDLPSPKDLAILFVPQEDAEDLFGRQSTITDVSVLVEPGARLDRVIRDVERVLDPYGVTESVKRADQPSNFALQEEIEQNRVLGFFMPLLILAISSSSLLIALSRVVQSQRGEIGLAKALGYTDGQVLLHYLLFSLVIAGIGSVLGMGLGDLMARGIAAQYVDILGIPFLEHHVYWRVVFGAVAISTGACVLAGLAPAWRSARIPPAQAMHSDPNLGLAGGRIPLVERLLSPVLPRSFTFRIPLRNVFRARRRSAYTVIGIAFALVLTVATQSSFDSIDFLFDRVFGFSERWDVQAVYAQPFGGERIAEVMGWTGVRDVQGALVLPAQLRSARGAHDGILTALDPDADFHGFDVVRGDPAPEALSSGGMVIAASLASKLGVSVGDSVSVKTPYRDEQTTVRVAAIADETLGAPSFVSLATSQEIVGEATTRYNALYLRVDPRRAQAVEDDLHDLPGAIDVIVKSGLLEGLQGLMEFAYFYQALLLGFGFAMAFVVIYNTFTANVLERTREIATMRTIGESNGRLAVMVSIENLLLALVGLPLGVWLGVRTAQAMFAQFSSEAYSLTAVILPVSVAWLSASTLLVLLLSEVPPIRRIFRMDLAEATKVME